LHESFGRVAEAVTWFRKSRERDPGNHWWRLTEAYEYLSLGDFETAASIRKKMSEKPDPAIRTMITLDYFLKLAQGKLSELPGIVDKMPPKAMEELWLLRSKALANLMAGDLQKAREYWLKWAPGWADPGQWRQLINEEPAYGCHYAGILMTTGDEALGKDLLRQVIHYHEEILPTLVEDSHRWQELGWCYLIEGSYEKALDFYELRIAHGHISKSFQLGRSWWIVEKLPWWEPVRDHPRYTAMVNKIEEMLAEQRELLRQMDESGTTVP